MKWLLYALLTSLLAAGAIAATAKTGSEAPPKTQETEQKDDDFVPTEKVPADSAISFPVDI